MTNKLSPIIICRLCDENGKILNAYDKNAIKFHELTSSERQLKRAWIYSGRTENEYPVLVSIEGFVAVSIGVRNLSAPIPFRIVQWTWVCAPRCAKLNFIVNNFICQAMFASAQRLKILIKIEIVVRSQILIDPFNGQQEPPACIAETDDAGRMLSKTCLLYGIGHLKAEVIEYNALSDGEKRVYTNSDNIKEYGGNGILDPCEVSCYNLYVNGVLQPKVDYVIKRGRLEFVTEDIPAKGQTILLRYIVFWNKDAVHVTDYQYFAISDGQKRIYTDADAIKKYGHHGIPGPCEASYYNLFINGVLQPRVNYEVEKGVLKLKTRDVPSEGQPVILESVIISDPCGRFYRVETYQYDTLSRSRRIYDAGNELSSGDGILAPWQSSYQDVFVNAVNQPKADYRTMDGYLVLVTEDLPLKREPISMQSVRVMNDIC